MSYTGKNLVGTLVDIQTGEWKTLAVRGKEQMEDKNKANVFQMGRMEDVILILLFIQT